MKYDCKCLNGSKIEQLNFEDLEEAIINDLKLKIKFSDHVLSSLKFSNLNYCSFRLQEIIPEKTKKSNSVFKIDIPWLQNSLSNTIITTWKTVMKIRRLKMPGYRSRNDLSPSFAKKIFPIKKNP